MEKSFTFARPSFILDSPACQARLSSGTCESAFNMAMDEALLENASRFEAGLLRFYGWRQPAASFGYFQRYAGVERATRLRPLVRRPTAATPTFGVVL